MTHSQKQSVRAPAPERPAERRRSDQHASCARDGRRVRGAQPDVPAHERRVGPRDGLGAERRRGRARPARPTAPVRCARRGRRARC